jgi:hypothetical protein
MRISALAGTAVCAWLWASVAHAGPTKTECIAAFDQGQQSRSNGHLRQAQKELLVCTDKECPALVRADCANVLREVEDAQPTIVFKATDGAGRDLSDVTIQANGEKLVQGLDGRAIAVDPGKLSLTFEAQHWPKVTMEVVIRESEKRRIVTAVLGPVARAAPVAERAPTASSPTRGERSTVGWVVPGGLVAVGGLALGIAGLLRIGLGNEADDLRASCGLSCSQADRDRLSNELVDTNVLLGVGIGAVALAAVAWFILAPARVAPVAASLGPRTPPGGLDLLRR